MRTLHLSPLTRHLPLVLSTLAIACSANDDSRSRAHGQNGSAAPETKENGASAADPAQTGDQAFDDDTRDSDGDRADPSADDTTADGVSAGKDSDGDGLSDSAETNTRVFRDKNDTGTDPRNWDSDGDGLSDGDEVLGTAGGLDLPKLGTNPLHKNILMEYDWFEDSNDSDLCGAGHSHRPTPAALNMVTATFAASPVQNPDGTTGIKIIHDYGQGGVFGGGNRVADSDGLISGGATDSEFVNYRSKNMASNRDGYFHYVLMPHRYYYYDDQGVRHDASSGNAQIYGGDMIVSLYCAKTDYNVASTIVHELGHNLNLRHGGDSDTNFKPNYNSVMNYRYQFDGIDTNCALPGDHVIDYSRHKYISLNESALDERRGFCGTSAWDWNGNKVIEASVSLDINDDQLIGVLDDYDDWAAIKLDGQRRPSLVKRDESPKETAICDSRPPGY